MYYVFLTFLILLKIDLRTTLVLFHTCKHIHTEQDKRQMELDTCHAHPTPPQSLGNCPR